MQTWWLTFCTSPSGKFNHRKLSSRKSRGSSLWCRYFIPETTEHGSRCFSSDSDHMQKACPVLRWSLLLFARLFHPAIDEESLIRSNAMQSMNVFENTHDVFNNVPSAILMNRIYLSDFALHSVITSYLWQETREIMIEVKWVQCSLAKTLGIGSSACLRVNHCHVFSQHQVLQSSGPHLCLPRLWNSFWQMISRRRKK